MKTRPPVSPFNIPPEQFFDQTHTIVVTPVSVVGEVAVPESVMIHVEAPVSVVGEVAVPESVMIHVEALILEEMQGAGFSVFPPSVYTEVWRRIVEESGGFYDPYTGERDDERYDEAVNQLHDELTERYEPDALLYPELWEVEASLSGGRARWNGTTQEIFGAREMEGTVLALSVVVALEDMAGQELYLLAAGVELLETLDRGLWRYIPEDQLFGDPERIAEAVRAALAPIVQARTAPGIP